MTGVGLSLDTGALIAIDRGARFVLVLVNETLESGGDVSLVAGVLAQAWRGGPSQARLARMLMAEGVVVVDLDAEAARAVGELCGRSQHADIVDVHVVLHARELGHRVVTSDPDDLRRVDPSVPLIVV